MKNLRQIEESDGASRVSCLYQVNQSALSSSADAGPGMAWRGVAWLGCCARFLSTEQPCPMPDCFICYLDRKIYPRHIPGVSGGFDSPNSHCSTVGLWKMYGYKMIVIPA